ncbi:MAG: outer membrane beta-barrel protein [Salinivirgaceae bacterium]|jgi:hypothetical protein|nr:outer membrane beta-barrel protein [Salinivirgaceae bacterium]
MKTLATLFIILQFSALTLFGQSKFYINPSMGIVWNEYNNSNPRITGNEKVSNIFWDNDFIIGLMAGYNFHSQFIIESGVRYHNAANRYSLDFENNPHGGGSTISLGEGFLEIPVNVKYNIPTGIKNLYVTPYIGAAISTHKINKNPYTSSYTFEYDTIITNTLPTPSDTIDHISASRPTKNTILLTGGLGVEYTVYENIVFSIQGNFTMGFEPMNKLDVLFFSDQGTESGEIVYEGKKFFLTAGIHIPISCKSKTANKPTD